MNVARGPRIQHLGEPFSVILGANNRQEVFNDDEERTPHLDRLGFFVEESTILKQLAWEADEEN
jgi:hypothetical protein